MFVYWENFRNLLENLPSSHVGWESLKKTEKKEERTRRKLFLFLFLFPSFSVFLQFTIAGALFAHCYFLTKVSCIVAVTWLIPTNIILYLLYRPNAISPHLPRSILNNPCPHLTTITSPDLL